MDQQETCPFVSVVVPVFNSRRTIGPCIEALLAQDYPADRFEVLVVDNKSTDGTDAVVRDYPVRLLYERTLQTSYAARNAGIRAARGEIVAFTDADCLPACDWLRELVVPFADRTVEAVGGLLRDVEPTNVVEAFLYERRMFARENLDSGFLPVLITNNAAYRRDALLDLGLFDARLFTGADVDCSWRLQLNRGGRVAFAPRAVVLHRHRATVKGMYLQQRRHAFGTVLLTAMYHGRATGSFTRREQVLTVGRQLWALLTYVRSALYRTVVGKIKGKDALYVATPLLCMAAESGALIGRLSGLWATRLFTRGLGGRRFEDPGER